MSRGGARSPLPERVVSPSPARDALQGNLDSSRTLTTKRSWFGSARNMISKHVPLWKTEDPKAETDENLDQASNDSEQGSVQQEQSGSNDSTTPLRPRPERQRTFTPKSAVSSLRQHIQSSRGQRKRGALGDITSNEVRLPVDPGSLAALEEGTSEIALSRQHTRKNSLGRSLVGSIRNLGSQSPPSRRISPAKRKSQDEEALLSPTKGATEIPLPSSPIPIAPPPALQLDLGPAALVTPSFGRSPDMSPRAELMHLTNPGTGGYSIGPVPTYYTRLPGEGPGDHAMSGRRDSLQPSDLLQLPVDDFGYSMPSGPTTPMPGAGAALELDGGNDPSEIFERSLEYRDKTKKKEDRKLKKMVSLDAMAEECTSMSPARASPASRSPGYLVSVGTPLRKTSGSTITAVPDDMPPLTRQVARLQTAETGHRNPIDGEWKSDDPFAPGNVVGDLATTPSPGKNIKLPFRPKITLQAVDSSEAKTLRLSNEVITPIGDGVNFSDYPKALPSMSIFDGAVESVIRPVPGRTDSSVANIDGFSPTEAERRGCIVDATTANGAKAIVDPGEYSEFKTQHIFGDLNKAQEPEYDVVEQAEAFSLIQTLRHSPSVKQIYERISKSHNSSPRSFRSGTTHKTDVADIFWKSNVGEWMKGSEDSQSGGLDIAPSPRRDCTDPSIDLLSTVGEQPTPNPSPTTTTPDRTPMGSRVDFDLKRSSRNLRYKALSEMSDPPDHESAASDPNSIPAAWGCRVRVTTGSFRSKGRNGSSIDDGEAGTSLKTCSRYSTVNLSSDSITADLKDAIAEHHVFQSAMADMGPEEFPTPTASSSQALLDGQAVSGELSPSDSAHLWENMEHSVFDTPLGGSTTASPDSKHHRESQEYLDNEEVDEPAPLPEDTLDDCLEMFQHYNRFQVLSSDAAERSDQSENPFSSPKSGSSAASSPNKKPTPLRYRSQKGRK